MEPVVGFEPTTDGLQNRCSTTELNWRRRAYFLRGAAVFGKNSNRAKRKDCVRHAVDDFFVGGEKPPPPAPPPPTQIFPPPPDQKKTGKTRPALLRHPFL